MLLSKIGRRGRRVGRSTARRSASRPLRMRSERALRAIHWSDTRLHFSRRKREKEGRIRGYGEPGTLGEWLVRLAGVFSVPREEVE